MLNTKNKICDYSPHLSAKLKHKDYRLSHRVRACLGILRFNHSVTIENHEKEI